MTTAILEVFQNTYRELRPETKMPEFCVEFRKFVSITNNIRLRDGTLTVKLSDLLEDAPQNVLESIAHILLAKVYRKPVQRNQMLRYRRYVASHEVVSKAHSVRQARGRKRITNPQGFVYNLEAIFDELNLQYFFGFLARPRMSWSQLRSRHSLGHFDPAHNTIVVSRVFDYPMVPRYAVEYIVYHEMLHLKHPVKLRGTKRCVHSAEFRAEEKLFGKVKEAKAFLKKL